MRIILDMDEVIADFRDAAAQLHGLKSGEHLTRTKAGIWEMDGQLGVTLDQFWHPIHEQGEAFWTGLARLPWCRELVTLVDEVSKGQWLIASSPSMDPACYSGKCKWLRMVLGSHFNQFSLGSHKHFYAQKGTVLIDDRELNCDKFREHGGQAIVFPSHGNKYHAFKDNPVPFVVDTFKMMGQL